MTLSGIFVRANHGRSEVNIPRRGEALGGRQGAEMWYCSSIRVSFCQLNTVTGLGM
jgi:hypothetical protein